jgi:preprotein translocase subunit YajC
MFISPAFAQTAGAATGPSFFIQMLPLVAIIAIFYFLLIRPQQKRMRAHAELIGGVRRGDVVVTSGGIIGKVTKVDDAELTVEIAENVRVKVVKSTLTDVRTKGDPVPANDDKK